MRKKQCSRCLRTKDIDEFYMVNATYYRNECKTCTKLEKKRAYSQLTASKRADRVHKALVHRHMSNKPQRMITEAFILVMESKGYSTEYTDTKVIFSINERVSCYIRNREYTEIVFLEDGDVITPQEFWEEVDEI